MTVVGLALIPLLALQENLGLFQISARLGLVGILYITICTLGILAVFYPTRCKNMFRKSQNPLPKTNKRLNTIGTKGHHPACESFSANRVIFNGRTVCAACGGLLIGAITAAVGATLYFFAGLNFLSSSVWLLMSGEICILVGLTQIKFAGYVKVAANFFFVIGSFVTLVEADLLGKSLLVDLYVLALIAFVLWLRISLSEWNNRRVCRTCQLCF